MRLTESLENICRLAKQSPKYYEYEHEVSIDDVKKLIYLLENIEWLGKHMGFIKADNNG